MAERVTVVVETMSIPTYPIMECEKMPMFNENRQHQGTKGNPYPVMPVLSVVRQDCRPRDYEVIRLENDYLRLLLIPELGGRIFEAYDKINNYHFFYRQHVIKPALIGAYGLWISGGLEFNWPFHHRPSTFMPVNFATEILEDGSAIAWLSECDPTDRTRATVGIVLRPDAAFFETRIQVTNRTPLRHSFLMWQNAAVPVNDDYQFIFPPDVTYAVNHHHASRTPVTYPIAHGDYANAYYDQPTDISWYKNCFHATSHFSAPSRYDFFGGYDHNRRCGVIHIADNHISPGKKMFTWGKGELASQWEKALTDEDGRYCELMAGSYSNNQPDFTWLNPYESKMFSQFWYPVGSIGKASFATLEAAVSVHPDSGWMALQTTRDRKGLRVRLTVGDKRVLNNVCDCCPGKAEMLSFPPCEGMYTVELIASNEEYLLHYRQETPDLLHFPEPAAPASHPDRIQTVQELYLQGLHVDQYRHPQIEPDIYYREALRRDPDHIPSLVGLGEYHYRRGWFADARLLLERAVANEHRYNLHYPDGEAEYLLGLTLDALGETDMAYDRFRAAAWSGQTAARALCKAAAIDGRRGNWTMMLKNALGALESAMRHPIAYAYAALAEIRLGHTDAACARLEKALSYDTLNDLAAFLLNDLSGDAPLVFWENRRSDAAQTALDIAIDLMDAGCNAEAMRILESVEAPTTPMVDYVLACALERQGINGAEARLRARCTPISLCFPYRLAELDALEAAIIDPADAVARHLLACELYDKGHVYRAEALWREAVRINPENAVYLRCLAVALFSHLNRKDEALALLERAVELEPMNNQLKLEYLYAADRAGMPGDKRLAMIHNHPWIGRLADDYVLAYTKACCFAGQWNEALDMMLSHKFVPAEGGEKPITNLFFSIVLRNARKALAENRAQEALDLLLSLSGPLPENLHAGLWNETDLTPVYFYQAEALKALGQDSESRKHYELAIKRFSPGLFDFASYYAGAMRALGHDTEARVFLSRRLRALDDMATLHSIGWEDMTSSFNSYMNYPQTQRDGMIAWWRAMIIGCEDDRTDEMRTLLQESLQLWPENLNAFIELELIDS